MSQFQPNQPTVKLPPPPRKPSGPSDQQINIPLILVAVALGLITVIATNWYIIDLRHTINTDTITLYQLKVSVQPGEVLKRKDLDAIQVPAKLKGNYVEDLHAVTPKEVDNYTDPKAPTKFAQAGRQGQLLTFDLLLGSDGNSRVEPAEGKRAVPLPIDTETALPNLDPMSYVDISAIVNPRGQRTQSMLVMERVRVLAVGDRTANSPNVRRNRNYSTITVEVDPIEAQQLATIQQFAQDHKFRITGRNAGDNTQKIYSGGVNPELLRALGLPVPSTARNN